MDSLTLYLRLTGMRIRAQLQYRASIALEFTGSFLSTIVELLVIVILFRRFHELAGWSVGEVALLYGLVSIAWGIAETSGEGLDHVSLLIRSGDFDRLLTRPISPFIQVLAGEFQLRRLGRVAQGLFAVGLAQVELGLVWTPAKIVVFAGAVVCSIVVFFTVLLIGAAICFWTIESSEAQNVFTYGGTELASYPLPIYHPLMRGLFLSIVPLALTSYYPALYILDKPDALGLPALLRFVAPLAAGAFLTLGLGIWRLGLRHYQSTGS